MFEITENEFNNYKSKVLKVLKDNDKIQFKDFKERNKAYMLIDNSGNAWIPVYDEKLFSDKNIKIEERKLIGNINNVDDWEKICNCLRKEDDRK